MVEGFEFGMGKWNAEGGMKKKERLGGWEAGKGECRMEQKIKLKAESSKHVGWGRI